MGQPWYFPAPRSFPPPRQPPGESTSPSPHRHAELAPLAGGRWYKRHLTYRVVNWPSYLPQHEVRLAVKAAFELWSNVSSLVFWEARDGPADIRLTFFHGDHNDGLNNAFDGPGAGRFPLVSFSFTMGSSPAGRRAGGDGGNALPQQSLEPGLHQFAFSFGVLTSNSEVCLRVSLRYSL